MKDNTTHRFSSDDFGAVDAPFLPSPSNEASERIAHALEYIASALSVLIDAPSLPPAAAGKIARPAEENNLHSVVRLEANDRHWTAH